MNFLNGTLRIFLHISIELEITTVIPVLTGGQLGPVT